MKPDFEDFSWFDSNGRLLKIQDEDGYVYRAITENSLRIFRSLEEYQKLDFLFNIGLVETELTAFKVEGYAAVLRHKKIPFISEPNEWTMKMLAEAGKTIVRLAIELNKLGYALQDAHPWNVSFEGAKPIFFDWGSIINKEQVTPNKWLLEFRKHIYLPIWLYSKGFKTIAYESLWERRGGSAKYLFNHRYFRFIPFSYNRLLKSHIIENFQQTLLKLFTLISKIKIDADTRFWSDYDQTSYAYKDLAFDEFLAMISIPSDIMDFGCNKGAYSIKCSHAGHQLVALDNDEKSVDSLFEYVKENGSNITPLRIDVMRPTPNYGPDLRSLNLFDRLKCDYVIAFAISHHLAKNCSLRFEALARILSYYSKKGVLVEFVDPEDYHLKNWSNKGWKTPNWYSEQNFIDSFSLYFKLVKKWETPPGDRNVRKILYFQNFNT